MVFAISKLSSKNIKSEKLSRCLANRKESLVFFLNIFVKKDAGELCIGQGKPSLWKGPVHIGRDDARSSISALDGGGGRRSHLETAPRS